MNETEFLSWFDELHDEVITIFHRIKLFKFTNDTLTSNPALKNLDQTYPDWILQSSTVDLSIRVSRLCDDGKDTKSLVRFLRELKMRDNLLKRERFIGLYPDHMKNFADRDFGKLVHGNKTVFSTQEIDQDIFTLTQKEPCAKIVAFRNDYVGHLSKKQRPLPVYDDLFSAAEILCGLIKKYQMLLNASNIQNCTPVIQGDWEVILSVPWIV